ncbi:MAG TPA: hemerythrin domain-containing protein [Anaeromyxobacteraceae bacterium]|nr:hemerythrin domain-containing protein [Anaeromyxobacteraceae bacterium]
MGAIETLMGEHRIIERGLDALAAFAGGSPAGGADDRRELGRFVEFIREFADACHHGKEEDILFEAMVQAGFPREGGPIAVMLHEHDVGRAFVRRLAALADQASPWSDQDRQALAEAAHGYASLLRQHIQKEDQVLYPMARQRLPPPVLEQVDRDCARYEEEKTGAGEHERLHRLAEELAARHAPARTGGTEPQAHR